MTELIGYYAKNFTHPLWVGVRNPSHNAGCKQCWESRRKLITFEGLPLQRSGMSIGRVVFSIFRSSGAVCE